MTPSVSPKDRSISRHRKVHRVCQRCGAGFLARARDVRLGWGLACSRACSNNLKGDMIPAVPVAERFWAKVQKSDGCWLWTGARSWGYGILSDRPGGRKGMHKAHRVSWRLHFGEIPAWPTRLPPL